MLASEIVKLLETLNEEQLSYVYTYIKEYFGINDTDVGKKQAQVIE